MRWQRERAEGERGNKESDFGGRAERIAHVDAKKRWLEAVEQKEAK